MTSDELKKELMDLLHQHSIASKGLGRIIQHNSTTPPSGNDGISDDIDNSELEMFQLESEFTFHVEETEKAILSIFEEVSF